MQGYAKIIIDLHHQKVDTLYTYRISSELQAVIREGMLVEVPFGAGNRLSQGYVIELTQERPPEGVRLKEVRRVISPEPVFTADNLALARQMQARYHAPLSACLALFVPKNPEFSPAPVEKVDLLLAPEALQEAACDRRLGKTQRTFLQALAAMGGQGCLLKEVRRQAPLSRESLRSLVQKQYVHLYEESEGKPPAAFISAQNEETTKALPLNEEQLRARRAIEEACDAAVYRGFLLHGITGSGKTEVYMQCIEHVLAQGKRAIVLVPEISLTPQLIRIFGARFPGRVGVTHSRMTDAERSRQWQMAKDGAYDVMIGPRSALFMPLPNLGLVVLDEEHETSYQSEKKAPHYHAAEVAAMLCRQKNCPLVLGSATPRIETYYAAQQGELTLLVLSRRAVRQAALPRVELVDMRAELEGGNMSMFCDRLVQEVRRRLQRKEQTILFLNRKGYATFVSCRACGFVLRCPRCYLPYTYHKDQNKLICHHCGKEAAMPEYCPQCGSPYIRSFGAGTQRVQEQAEQLFPGARILRMDMGTMRKQSDYQEAYEKFRRGEGDILIGTQMIAKGFDFPLVTLVGVLAADMTLYSSDYHSAERTFQLITQVAGRAGRADKEGLVLVQTYSPDHYCIQKASEQDYEGFYRNEITARKLMDCPPFTHLAQILLSGSKEEVVRQGAARLAHLMARYAKGRPIEVLGPSPATLGRINNVFRWKLLVKCKQEERLRSFADYCLAQFLQEEKRLVSVVDIDPMTII